ncbi:FtsB family cell division protein [Arundinibacter roseus]|uniref:Septum formation initiator family protein n=1 Tax=Arundinibacter roseus TaxID=2070510 RepID=A0A4R4KLH2_9BACT|nr:septum formation initiator family protein [Arundinibacter roseus]TDB68783.1 septum formation initiator family protein [Arundinibacter roseus]
MVTIPAWLRKAFLFLRKFYAATFIGWLVWIFVIDDNNLFVVWENRQKMLDLERDRSYFIEQVKLVRKEHDEVFGSKALLEKWAREKYMMRKPSEDVYVIVDENGEYIEKK